jgi:DNA polymerase III alpha subunit
MEASRQIANSVGRRIKVAGMAAAARTTRVKAGRTMCFVTLGDEDGLFEVTLFPDVYERYRKHLVAGGSGLFLVEGRVESQYDAVSVTAERIGFIPRNVVVSGDVFLTADNADNADGE